MKTAEKLKAFIPTTLRQKTLHPANTVTCSPLYYTINVHMQSGDLQRMVYLTKLLAVRNVG
jgi:hypothetical protein